MVNSVDPDQMLHFAASDQGLHCLLGPVCRNMQVNMVLICLFQLKKFNPFLFGDSSEENKKAKISDFCDKVEKVIF